MGTTSSRTMAGSPRSRQQSGGIVVSIPSAFRLPTPLASSSAVVLCCWASGQARPRNLPAEQTAVVYFIGCRASRVHRRRRSTALRDLGPGANMSESRPTLAVRLATTFLFFICMVAASQWCLNRFWLYHAQNRVLQPSDYTVSVAPAVSGSAADARLSDDGQFSVKVVTVGTSHAMDQV